MIDIVITNHNNGSMLRKCLESVAMQTVADNIRVILVDDASTDDSIDDAYAAYMREGGNEIFVIHNKENVGAGMSRRIGIHKALKFNDSEYTMFLDGDDELTPNVIGDMYKDALKHDADLAICKVKFVGGDNDGIVHDIGCGLISPKELRKREAGKLCGFLNNILIKTSLWVNVEYSSLRFIEDWPTKQRLLHYVKSIVASDAGYYLYNYNANSLCRTCSNLKYSIYTILSMIEVCDFYKDIDDFKSFDSFKSLIRICMLPLSKNMEEVLMDWFDEIDTICKWCNKNMPEYVNKNKS